MQRRLRVNGAAEKLSGLPPNDGNLYHLPPSMILYVNLLMQQAALCNERNRLKRLSDMGDPLEKLRAVVDFELFRPLLRDIFSFRTFDRGQGDRPAMDTVLMFKILVLQDLYRIADDSTEYLINDRLSFQRFVGMDLGDKVHDAKTIWLFRDTMTRSGRMKGLFDVFTNVLKQSGVITRRGSIIDVSFNIGV